MSNRRWVWPLVVCVLATSMARAHDPGPGNLPATTPWDLKNLKQTPEFEWLDDKGPVRSLLYEGEPYAGKPTRVFAYYATPGTLTQNGSQAKALPAVVLIHGGGGTAFREWAELWARRGYAAIAMDLAGHRPMEDKNPHQRENRTRLPDGGPDQGDAEKFGSIDKPAAEQWPYHAIAAVLRAHSLIRSFREVDADRTAVTGISWGGYLTCIAAGVDDRFRAAVPVYGCGFLHENSAWLDRFSKMTPPQRERWVTLWDPSQYLPAASMPMLFVNGTNDFAYPLDSYMKSVDSVRGAKQFRITVNMPHGHPPGWAPAEIGLFVDHHLLGKPGLATVGIPQLAENQIRLTCQSSVKLAKAELHVSKDGGPINKRLWTTLAAKLKDGVVTVAAPPPGATAWFLTVADERGAIVSSRVTIRPAEPEPIRIALIGDSTVASYANPPADRPDLTGWGQVLGELFESHVEVANHAASGRSSKSFLREGRWQKVLDDRPNYVFIQFGHNDQPGKGDRTTDPEGDYQDHLKQYLREARQIGARPILVTPVARRTFQEGKPVTTLQPYVDAMQKVGRETATPVIDLHAASLQLFGALGDEGSAHFSASATDRTHFSRRGALAIARLVTKTLPVAVPELAAHLRRSLIGDSAEAPQSMLAQGIVPDPKWTAQAAEDAKQDFSSIPYDGKSPNKMVCDTTLRELPDGSWILFLLAGGNTEPSPLNYTGVTRSTDQGRTWTPLERFDVGFPREGKTIGQGPTELMIRDGRATLFFSTHSKHWANDWRSWFLTSDDSFATWSQPAEIPGRLKERTFIRNSLVTRDGRIMLPFQHYIGPDDEQDRAPLDRAFTNPRNGVLISSDGGRSWSERGDIRLTPNDRYFGWAENNLVELKGGRIAMLIRADGLGGVLFSAESKDGGRTWPEFASVTRVPNPGSKATLYPLGGDTVAMLHNPNSKHRSPLSLWISFDGLKTWPYQRVLHKESVDGPSGRINYPDGFVSADKQWLHFAFDDNHHRAVHYSAKLPPMHELP